MANFNLQKNGGVLIITINREDKMNSLSFDAHYELVDIWKEFNTDENARVAVITGAGDKAFCAGADLKTYTMDFATRRPDAFRDEFVNGYGLGGITRGLLIDKPVIAAINGYAVSGGLEIALACDFRFSSSNAKFGLQDVKWGFHACDGALVRLPSIIGLGNTMELVLTGELIDADRALKINLVNKVFDRNLLMTEVMKVAETIASNGGTAIRYAKQFMRDNHAQPIQHALKSEVRSFYDLGQTEDLAEGTQAFREKRAPKF